MLFNYAFLHDMKCYYTNRTEREGGSMNYYMPVAIEQLIRNNREFKENEK